MNRDNMLGQLSLLHQMLNELLLSVPEEDAYRRFHPGLAPLAWYLGRSMYMETYWLREVVQGDADITARSREVFIAGPDRPAPRWNQLPPREHLLNWAMELQDGNLTCLANPALLGRHSLLQEDRLLWLILQEHGEAYEQMLMVLTQRQLQRPADHQVSAPLHPSPPPTDATEIPRGHYRIGAREDPGARDNEQPAQIVELSSYRIARAPVSNGNWLAFMQDGGYQDQALWSAEGRQQRSAHEPHPGFWRRNRAGDWFGVGLNGPFDLVADEPVTGVSRFEAEAYARWTAAQGGELAGAVVQHEYQWEVAARSGGIRRSDRVWEWCSNLFEPYSGYQAPSRTEERTQDFDDNHYAIRGASLHTQPSLRRVSFRNRGLPWERQRFTGTRLVFPPA